MDPNIKIIGLNRMRRAETTLRNLGIMQPEANWIHDFIAQGRWRTDEDTAFLCLHNPLECCLFYLWQTVFCRGIWMSALLKIRNWVAKCYPDAAMQLGPRRPPSCFLPRSEEERTKLRESGIDVDAYLADWEKRFGAKTLRVERQEVKPTPPSNNLADVTSAPIDTLRPVVSSRAVQTDAFTVEQLIELLKKC